MYFLLLLQRSLEPRLFTVILSHAAPFNHDSAVFENHTKCLSGDASYVHFRKIGVWIFAAKNQNLLCVRQCLVSFIHCGRMQITRQEKQQLAFVDSED